MHILINGQFWTQPNVGSGQYLHGLVRWLPRVAPQHRYTLLLPATNTPSPDPPVAVTTLTLRTPFDGHNENLAKLWFEQISIPRMADMLSKQREHDTVLHIPYFAPPASGTIPVITTIPDIIPLILPKYRGGLHVRAYMALVRRTVHHSTHVITFSAYSKQDIVQHLGIAQERITPTMLAADERYKVGDKTAAIQAVAERYGLHPPFIYYVGGLDVRKNVEILIRAVAQMNASGAPHFTLAIAGKALSNNRQLFPDIDMLVKKLRVGDNVRRIEVPFEDGPLLYQACTLFAFPSTYEGFGLPPLEAMACGAPVVCSDASSLPEVVGHAALCIAPDDVAEWATALNYLLQNPTAQHNMRQRGLAQARQFSWRKVAEETCQIYEDVLASI